MHRNIDWYQRLGLEQTGRRTVDGYQRIFKKPDGLDRNKVCDRLVYDSDVLQLNFIYSCLS